MRSDTKTWDKLWTVLDQDDPSQTVYGYRVDQAGQAIKPYLFCWSGHSGVVEGIQRKYGPGEYRLLIRKGQDMIFSGYILIGGVPRSGW